jgi:MFS family permease
MNVLDGSFYAFGLAFISQSAVLPVLVTEIGGSAIAVGLIPVVWTIGFNFPQIFIAHYASGIKSKKALVMKTAIVQRLPWLLLSLAAFYVFDEVGIAISLILFFIGFAMAAVGGAFNLPGWFDLISKVTPVNLRGRLFAFRVAIGGIFGIIAGAGVKIILDNFSYPNGYGILFLTGFLIMMISYLFVCLIKEELINEPKRSDIRYKDFLLSLPTIFKKEKNYRNFLISDAFIMIAQMAPAFFTVHAFYKFNLTPGYVGVITIVMMTATIIGSFAFGYLADHLGHRINLFFEAVFMLAACAISLIAGTVEVYYFVFVFAALASSLMQISRLTIVAEFCVEEERPTYIALTNLLTVPFTFSGILGGVVANKFGYEPVFVISGIFALLSAIWISAMMTEPRTKTMKTIINK